MNTDIALITYTNSVMEDIWPIYFGELENNLNKCIKSFVFSDVLINIDENKNTKCILYENSSPYYQQYVSGLDSVSENYIIYAQEDFFLYGKVDHEKIIKLKNILENSSYDYIRLIRAGYETPLNQSEYENLYKVDMNSSDAFSMQATIWKKSSLIKFVASSWRAVLSFSKVKK